jgi:hypothetical protein
LPIGDLFMRGLDDRSRMSREAHVRVCEGLGVRVPRATRRAVFEADRKPVVHSSYHMLFLLQLNVKATFIISCQYCAFHNYTHFSIKADCKLTFYIAKGAVAQCH